MNKYRLTYARCVIMETDIEADSYEEAGRIAWEMEYDGDLGLLDYVAKTDSWVRDVEDDENIWEIELVEDDEPDGEDQEELVNVADR